jgi:coenzyme Q-binding protein COQ10
LPYCLSSEVTAWSKEDKLLGRKWPEEAVLEVGWGALRERFKSRIFCSPGRERGVVEAVWGEGECKLSKEEIEHHVQDKSGGRVDDKDTEEGDGEGILTHLWTRWTVTPVNAADEGKSGTEVSLDIEFRFANPVYAAMSSAVVDKVADVMIDAFEKRVEEKLGAYK